MDFDTMYGLMNPQGPDQGAIGRAMQTPEGQAAIAREMAAKGIRPQSFMQRLGETLGMGGGGAPMGAAQGQPSPWSGQGTSGLEGVIDPLMKHLQGSGQPAGYGSVPSGLPPTGSGSGPFMAGAPHDQPPIPPGLLAAMAPQAEGMEGRKPSGPMVDPVLASPLAAAASGGGGDGVGGESLSFTGGGDAAAAAANPLTKVLDAVAKGGVGPLAGLKAPAGVTPIMPSGAGPALPGRQAMQGSPVAALIQAMMTGQGGGGNPALALRLGQALTGGR